MARSIFIGDVHGCALELGELLDRIGPTASDRVYFVGDLVARGPDSRGVLKLYREVNGKGVLGNHEARILHVHRARLAGEEGPPIGPSHEAVVRELDNAEWALIESLPLHLDVSEHDVRIVHAGIHPGRAFEDQDAWTLLHIRSVNDDGAASDKPGEASWSEDYRSSPHIVFGHDARRGLQLRKHATGLDSACVYGSSLTALVLPRKERVPHPHERRDLLVSVRARAAYYSGHR